MFKSYTRKSSAIVGAARAGKTESDVCQHEGKWGFWEKQPESNVVVIHGRPEINATVKLAGQPKLGDRRKVLRGVYRGLKELRQHNRTGKNKFDASFLRGSAQRLRQSYRCADISRA